MRMVNAERMLLCRDIIAQHKVKFIFLPPHARDRGDRVVRFPVRLRKDKRRLVGIPPPCGQNAVSQRNQTFPVPAADAYH